MTIGSRRSVAKREQILRAAERLFLQNGFALTSMDAVTAAAGVSKQTVYSYFSSKENLFETVLRDLVARNVQIIAQEHDPEHMKVSSREEFATSLKEVAARIVHSLMQPEYLRLVKVIIAEFGRSPQLAQHFRHAVPERIMMGIIRMLNHAREAGVARIPDTEIAARLFIGPLLTYVLLDGLLAGHDSPQPPARERLDMLVDQYLETI